MCILYSWTLSWVKLREFCTIASSFSAKVFFVQKGVERTIWHVNSRKKLNFFLTSVHLRKRVSVLPN